MKTEVITHQDNNTRIDRWFKRHFPDVPFGLIAKLARKGKIKLDGKKAKLSERVLEGQTLNFIEPKVIEKAVGEKYGEKENRKATKTKNLSKVLKENIIYKDENIIAINKSSGIAVQGGTGINVSVADALEHLKFDYDVAPKIVHRLDKETSGVLVLARTLLAASNLSELLKNREVTKKYIALVYGAPETSSGVISEPLMKQWRGNFEVVMIDHEEGKEAITKYQLLDSVGKQFSLLQLEPKTGRTHQLRAHCMSIGCPIVGDKKYFPKVKNDIFGSKNKMYLHAHKINFEYAGKNISIEAPLPQYYKEILDTLGIDKLSFR